MRRHWVFIGSLLCTFSACRSVHPDAHEVDPTPIETMNDGFDAGPDATLTHAAPEVLAPLILDPDELSSGSCPSDMVEVTGMYCPVIKETCLEWREPKEAGKCKRFATPPGDAGTNCTSSSRVAKHYCIDRYEYPNQKGVVPKVLVSWDDAEALCRRAHKRMCRASEWSFACEGEQDWPYPYGYTRDGTACRIDLDTPTWDQGRDAGLPTTSYRRPHQVNVNFSAPSGSYPRCISPFRVYDLTGNADEWVSDEHLGPNPPILRGGWWGHLHNKCRTPDVEDHAKSYSDIQVSFRCCQDGPN